MWVEENFLKRGRAPLGTGRGRGEEGKRGDQCIPEGGHGRGCGLKGTLEKRPVSSSGEFNRAHGLRILVSMSKLLMLVKLLLGGTKALRTVSAGRKAKLFCFAARCS